MFKDTIDSINQFLRQSDTRRKLGHISDLCKNVMEIKDVGLFSPIKLSYIILSLIDTLTEFNEEDDPFEDWDYLFDTRFIPEIIMRALSKLPKTVYSLANYRQKIIVTLPSGIQLGYISSASTTKGNWTGMINDKDNDLPVASNGIKVQYAEAAKARNEVCNMIWAMYGGRSLELIADSEDKANIVAVDREPMMTDVTAQTINRVKIYLDNKHNRSILLYGPPGTGKTTTAYSVCKTLGLRTLIIPASISDKHLGSVLQFLKVGKPEAIIFDDFERIRYSQDNLLTLVENLRRNTRLIIATVNDVKKLTRAMIRPGRFDEILEINYIDSKVLETMVGKENEDLFDVMSTWPVCFIDEFTTTQKLLGRDAAIERVKELSHRVEYQSEEYRDPFTYTKKDAAKEIAKLKKEFFRPSVVEHDSDDVDEE